MQEAGIGELQSAFEALRRKLNSEGLFDAAKKRDIAPLPDHLAIITSATGAAIHDVMSVLRRRFPAMRSTLIPTQVQGEEATAQVVSALEKAAAYRDAPFDLILPREAADRLKTFGHSTQSLWRARSLPRLSLWSVPSAMNLMSRSQTSLLILGHQPFSRSRTNCSRPTRVDAKSGQYF